MRGWRRMWLLCWNGILAHGRHIDHSYYPLIVNLSNHTSGGKVLLARPVQQQFIVGAGRALPLGSGPTS